MDEPEERKNCENLVACEDSTESSSPSVGLDRFAARACVGQLASLVSAVSGFVADGRQTLHHVSASPRFHPGRSDFPSPVGGQSISPSAFPCASCSFTSSMLKRWLAYTPTMPVYRKARHPTNTAPLGLCVPMRVLEMPVLCREPLCPVEALPLQEWPPILGLFRGRYPPFIAPTSSCARPPSSPCLRPRLRQGGLCRLLPAPAGKWPFPALSPQSLYRCLSPYPATSPWCTCPFLPRELRPHPSVDGFGTPKLSPQCNFNGGVLFGAAAIPLCSGSHTR